MFIKIEDQPEAEEVMEFLSVLGQEEEERLPDVPKRGEVYEKHRGCEGERGVMVWLQYFFCNNNIDFHMQLPPFLNTRLRQQPVQRL